MDSFEIASLSSKNARPEPFTKEQRLLHKSVLDDQNILSGQFWGELRVFLAVAKAKSFNRAAEILNASHPTVSRQVKRLQDVMGVQLLIATKHGVTLTKTGELLADSISQLDRQLYSLANGVKAGFSDEQGVVRLGITDGLGALFVAPGLSRFSRGNPGIHVHLKSLVNLSDLHENQTDMMIGFAPTNSSVLSLRPLGCVHFIPFASKQYISDNGLPTQNNIENHSFVQSEFYSGRSGHWNQWTGVCDRGTITHCCDSSFSYGMLVKSGLGIGLLGSFNVMEPSAVPLELGVHIKLPLYLIAFSERLRERPVRIVFDWLSEIFSPSNPWFSEQMRLDLLSSEFDIGYRRLFNL